MPITALAIGAALGLVKSEVIDAPKEKRQRKLAAETQRLSPWTGMQADKIQEADPAGSAIAFGTAAMQGKGGMDQAALNQKMAEHYLSGGGAPAGGGQSPWFGAAMPQQAYLQEDMYNPSRMNYGG